MTDKASSNEGFVAAYATDEQTGITTLVIGGSVSVNIEQRPDPKHANEPRFFVSNVRASQPNLKTALEWGARNAGLVAVHTEFNRQNPSSRKGKVALAEFEKVQNKMESLRQKLIAAGIDPDVEDQPVDPPVSITNKRKSA